jgi:(p)ppGpp synthase/HD superfamily hydrolase
MHRRDLINKERALLIAEKAHENQPYGLYPYMFHVRQVMEIAERFKCGDDIITAVILHDTIEETSLTYSNIKDNFGLEIADIIYCVTNELGRNRAERNSKTYPKIKNNWKATVVKLCDRIANIEHSKKYNSKLFKMYKNEHDYFYRSIKSEEHPISKTGDLWNYLGLLIS